MVADRTTQTYHLTPRGWIRGTGSVFSVPDAVVPTPEDRALTRTKHTEQSSIYSPDVAWITDDWRSPDEVLVAELLRKFGPSPGEPTAPPAPRARRSRRPKER